MSYKYTKFNGSVLPTYNRDSQLNTAPAQNSFLPTVQGGFDIYGPDIAPMATPHPLTLRAVISEDTDTGQRYALDGLRALVRVRGKLTREADNDGSEQWAWARLMSVNYTRNHRERGYQVLEFTWQVESGWYLDQDDQVETMDGSPYTLSVANGGNRMVNDAVITVTADDANLTALTITTTNGTHLVWTGTLTAGDDLVIDCGAKSILNDGANAYGGLSYGANHRIDDWLRIEGSMDITLTYTGGGTDPVVTIAFNEGWV